MDEPSFSQLFEQGSQAFSKGDFVNSLRAFSKAHKINPDHTVLNSNIAAACFELGNYDQSELFAKRAIELNPDYNRPHITLGMLRLLKEDFEAGWPEYEWVATLAEKFKSLPEDRKWKGEDLEGRRIVVIDEQGYGDTIQFIRFVTQLKQAGAEVFIDIKPPLRNLLQQSKHLGTVLLPGQPLEFSYWTRLLGIPAIIRATAADLTITNAYLKAKKAPATSKIHSVTGKKVGIIWKGSDANSRDSIRSLQAADFKPLLHLARQRNDLHFFHLHHQPFTEQIEAAGLTDCLTELYDETPDFADLASIIDSLDLVVTIDTAVAHLAGALGKKTFCLLSFVPDWRWGIDRDQSLWYPNTTLFRQPELNNWESPISAVASEVSDWAKKGPEV